MVSNKDSFHVHMMANATVCISNIPQSHLLKVYLSACGTVRSATYWEEIRSLEVRPQEGPEEYCKQGLLVHTWNSVIQKPEVEDHDDFKVSLASKKPLLQKCIYPYGPPRSSLTSYLLSLLLHYT